MLSRCWQQGQCWLDKGDLQEPPGPPRWCWKRRQVNLFVSLAWCLVRSNPVTRLMFHLSYLGTGLSSVACNVCESRISNWKELNCNQSVSYQLKCDISRKILYWEDFRLYWQSVPGLAWSWLNSFSLPVSRKLIHLPATNESSGRGQVPRTRPMGGQWEDHYEQEQLVSVHSLHANWSIIQIVTTLNCCSQLPQTSPTHQPSNHAKLSKKITELMFVIDKLVLR